MNWQQIFAEGHVKKGETLIFQGKHKKIEVHIRDDGSMEFAGQIFKRPGQLWTKYFNDSRRTSWLDGVSCNLGTIRSIRESNQVNYNFV